MSFLSPCVAPVVPGYLSYISGAAIGTETVQPRQTERVVIASVLFVLGFAVIFVSLGASAAGMGSLIVEYRGAANRLAGLLMVTMGLFVLGVLKIGPLSTDRRVHLIDRPIGPVGAVLVGMAFGLGWTPCIGPVLATILLYASTAETAQAGALLLLMYSLGLGLPFILVALGASRALTAVRAARRLAPVVNRASGLLLLAMGALFLTNQVSAIGRLNGATLGLFERLAG